MPDLQSKKQDFRQRLDELQSGHARQMEQDFTTLGDETLEARLESWETRLEQRVREHQEQAPSPTPKTTQPPKPAPPPPLRTRIFPHADPSLEGWLADLDSMFHHELELAGHPLPNSLLEPVRILPPNADMPALLRRGMGLPAGAPLDGIEPHRMAIFHIPGEATWLNFDFYAQKYRLQNFTDATPTQRANLVSEVAWERWGWGFWLEATAWGAACGAAGLWQALCAQRSHLAHSAPHLNALADAVRKITTITEAGWQDWVWQYVLFKSRHAVGHQTAPRPRPGRQMELLKRIVGLFPFYITPFGLRIRIFGLVDLVKFLFLVESELLPRTINSVLVAAQEFCFQNDRKVMAQTGMPFSQMLGRLYFASLEANVGILCTPYATLIGNHLDLGDTDLDPGRILQDAAEDPRRNPDTRLALLSRLDPVVKYDPKSMFTAAWERLHLDGPEAYF